MIVPEPGAWLMRGDRRTGLGDGRGVAVADEVDTPRGPDPFVPDAPPPHSKG